MADALYQVVVRLTTEGSLVDKDTISKVREVDKTLDKMGSSVGTIGASFRDMLGGIVDKVADIGVGITKWGAAGAMGLVTYGVMGLNNEFEKTKISLAAIFNANGVTSNITNGLGIAQGMMQTIRKDAAALPGETGDLLAIFRSNTIPGLRAGKDVNAIEKFSANVMAAGAASGLDMATVARESGQLLAGRAGSHNILGATLFGLQGGEAQAFNQKSSAERFDFLSKGMEKYGAAIGLYSKSFDGLSSTLYDNTKNYLRLATEPVFEKVKGALGGINDWMSTHDVQIQRMMQKIGDKIAEEFERGERAVLKWGPPILHFGEVLETRVLHVFQKLEPMAERFGKVFEKALSDPNGTIDKFGHLLELSAATKLAGPLAGLGEGVAGIAGASGGVAAGVGAGVAAAGAFDIYAMMQAVEHSKFAQEKWLDVTNKTADAMEHLVSIGVKVEPALDAVVDKMGEGMLFVMDSFVSQADSWISTFDTITTKLGSWFKSDLPSQIQLVLGFSKKPELGPDEVVKIDRDAVIPLMHGMARYGTTAEADEKKKKVSGGGGVYVARIEMVVNQNGDANRVARAVIDKISDMRRYPTSSRNVRNFSSSSDR